MVGGGRARQGGRPLGIWMVHSESRGTGKGFQAGSSQVRPPGGRMGGPVAEREGGKEGGEQPRMLGLQGLCIPRLPGVLV